jgi:ABC-type amino acid transport system permease subunit
MADILTQITTFLTSFLTWVADVVDFVTDTPLLMVFVIFAILSLVIGMVRRWIPGRGV